MVDAVAAFSGMLLACPATAGFLAFERGRSFWLWFTLGFVFQVFAIFALYVLMSREDGAAGATRETGLGE